MGIDAVVVYVLEIKGFNGWVDWGIVLSDIYLAHIRPLIAVAISRSSIAVESYRRHCMCRNGDVFGGVDAACHDAGRKISAKEGDDWTGSAR
jgi:hypothetical protein